MRDQRREIVNELKNVPCGDCGKRFPPYVMDFDHVRGEKSGGKGGVAIGPNWTKERILAEAAKCDVICANCHRIRTFNPREETTMGEMRILNQHGDERLDWNPDDAKDVARAKGEFERLKGEGYHFYEVVDTKGRKVTKFSAKAGKLIAAPGGRKEADKSSGERSRAMAGGPTARFATRA